MGTWAFGFYPHSPLLEQFHEQSGDDARYFTFVDGVGSFRIPPKKAYGGAIQSIQDIRHVIMHMGFICISYPVDFLPPECALWAPFRGLVIGMRFGPKYGDFRDSRETCLLEGPNAVDVAGSVESSAFWSFRIFWVLSGDAGGLFPSIGAPTGRLW